MKSVFLTSNTSWYLYNFRRSTIKALVDAGFKVLCLSPPDAFSARLESELGAKHLPLPLEGKSTALYQELRSLLFIRRMLKTHKPDYVFNFTVKMNIYGGLACLLSRTPYSNNISGLGTAFIHDSWLFRRVRQVYGYVNRSAERLFFQNQEDLSVFRECSLLGNTPVTLLPGSGVDLKWFGFQPLPNNRPITFLMIARLLGDKGVREYAEACRILKQEDIPVKCLLLGPLGVSNRTAIAEAEVRQWHQEEVLEYLGETDDVRPHICQAHVLVLPSYREGMPRTVLEAASMGRPAIVTDVPGCQHAIEPGVTGWLCEVRNASSLAERMREVVNMASSDLQKAGVESRKRMEQKFKEEIVVDAYLKCLGLK